MKEDIQAILRDTETTWKEEVLANAVLFLIEKLEELKEEVGYLKAINRDNIT